MRQSKGDRLFSTVNYVFFTLLCLLFIVPLWMIVSISISQESDTVKYGYSLIPKTLDFEAYRYIFSKPMTIVNAYQVTIVMTALGTLLSLAILSMCAYALSRRDFKYGKAITFYMFFTMLFSGGLVPYYILMTNYLHVQDTYASLILPLLCPVWYLLIMRTFFQQIPTALIEAATIDGAKEFRIYLSMILPMSKPVLATIGLMQLLMYWNSWFQALLFISDKDMYPLQYLLQVTLQNIAELLRNMQLNVGVDVSKTANIPTENIRMATAILAIGPMLFIYPFFQKYFSKGLTIGAIKE